MKLYTISVKNQPARIETLYRVNNYEPPFTMDEQTKRMFLVDTSKASLKRQYIFWFGFTWKERPKDVEIVELYTRQAEESSNRRNRRNRRKMRKMRKARKTK